MTVTIADRITSCLKGIAVGDAIGKQTEMLACDEVLRWYPHAIRVSKALQARSFRDMRAIRNASGGLAKPRTTPSGPSPSLERSSPSRTCRT